MAINYSYPKSSQAYGTDLLMLGRFEGEPANQARTVNVSLETIKNYVANSYIPTLNQVLGSGNISILPAKMGTLFLYNDHVPTGNGYVSLSGSKNRVNFYDNEDAEIGYIDGTKIVLTDNTAANSFSIKRPTSVTVDREATFQDASGTVAYLSNIPAATNYGLCAQVDDSTPIANTTTETSLLSGVYEGGLSVPANGFAEGDSFKASLMGHISCLSSATLQIRIKTATGVLLADTGVMDLDTTTAKHWMLNIEFTIRKVGTAGLASIISGGSFIYNRNASNNPEGFTFISINDNDFDTTIGNELVITAQWNNASASNSIYSDIFTLNKVY